MAPDAQGSLGSFPSGLIHASTPPKRTATNPKLTPGVSEQDSPAPDISQFEKGKGFGYTPGKDGLGFQLNNSSKGKLPLRGSADISRKPSSFFSEAASPSQLSGKPVMPGRSGNEPVALSLADELATEAEANQPKTESAFSKLGKALRRKSRRNSENKHEGPARSRPRTPGRVASPPPPPLPMPRDLSSKTMQTTREMEGPALHARPSVSEAPVVVLSSKAAFVESKSSANGYDAHGRLDALQRSANQRDLPAGHLSFDQLRSVDKGKARERFDRSYDQDNLNAVALDSTPTQERSPVGSLSTPRANMANGTRHKSQLSTDSSSSSSKRMSLAFLASAISMGAIADAATVDKEGEEDEDGVGEDADVKAGTIQSGTLSEGRPNTALGLQSPANDKAAEARPSLSSMPVTVSRSESRSSLSETNLNASTDSIPIRRPPGPRLVPKGATREDEIPGVLADFLKLDAMESQKLNKGKGRASSAATRSDADPEGRRTSESKSQRRPSDSKSALSTSPKTIRTPTKGTFMAPPAGPALGGFVSPFFVAPLTSVDAGATTQTRRHSNRRASAGSRSIASDDSRSTKSGASGARRGSTNKGAIDAPAKQQAPAPLTQSQTRDQHEQNSAKAARKTKSHNNLRSAAREREAESTLDRNNGVSASEKAKASHANRLAPSDAAESSVDSSRSPSRLRSASGSTSFGQRLFRRPRTGGPELPSSNTFGQLRVKTNSFDGRGPTDGSVSPRTKPRDSLQVADRGQAATLAASPTDSIEFEMLTPGTSRLNGSEPSAPAGRASADFHKSTGRSSAGGQPNRSSRGRSNSLASIDASVNQARANGPGRQSSDLPDSRNMASSRLESSGGAAGLFGGGASRQRTSSLLPSFGFGRSRTSSSAGLDGLPASGGTAKNSLDTPASGQESTTASLLRKASFRATPGSRQASGSSAKALARNASGLVLVKSEAVGQESREDSLEETAAKVSTSSSNRPSTSSRPSFSRQLSARSDANSGQPKASVKPSSKEFLPWDDEEPEDYAERMGETAPKAQIAAILASSGDSFYKDALNHFMTRFWFNSIPLDIALRKLLMDLHLPKETQQIDRVMEAFAKRYNDCNQNVFASNDQPYILAFSLMMLHTDAFNKNAKHKMTKADYLRNTSPSGVPTEILEYLFDNLTFTQFIYVEDEEDLQKRVFDGPAAGSAPAGSALLASQAGKVRIDPYYLISQGRLGEFRPEIDHLIPEDSPFSYTGTLSAFDVERLNAAFLHAPSIEIATGRPAMPTAPGAQPSDLSAASSDAAAAQQHDEVVTLKVTKVGVVSRKDDVADGGRKAGSRKWKTSGLLLTGSQLLIFKDIVWTSALQSQILDQVGHSQMSNGIKRSNSEKIDLVEGGVIISPRITYFRPDGVISLAGAVAVKDSTYAKYDHVFRLLAAKGRQYLVQAQNEDDMNDWIHKINFCACFRTVNIKIRGLDLSPKIADLRRGSESRRGSQSAAGSRKPSIGSDFRIFSNDGNRLTNQSSFASFSDLDSRGPSRPLSPGQRSEFGPDDGEDDYDDDEEQEHLDGDSSTRYGALSGSELSPRSKSRSSSRASNVQPMNLYQKRIAARRELMRGKIEETTAELDKVSKELADQMRLARHLTILTPFQKATRDRIEAAALPLASKIKYLRLEVAKVESCTKMLTLDLEEGERIARQALPSMMRLPSSAISEARMRSGSQLATPQLLELGGATETQQSFDDFFGQGTSRSADTSFNSDPAGSLDLSSRTPRQAPRQRRSSSDQLLAAPVRPMRSFSDAGLASQEPPVASSPSTPGSSKVVRPASHQRHQMNLNSVSEQPADESPVLNAGRMNGGGDDSFQSSQPSDPDLLANARTVYKDRLDPGAREERSRSGSPAAQSGSRSSTSTETPGRASTGGVSVPTEAEEVPEDWDMSKVAHGGSNRISLVDLPSPGELQEATTRRFVLGRTAGDF